MEEQMNTPAHVSFNEAFRVWTKIGFLSFGGPAGQIGLMHKMLVDDRKWISNDRFLHALNYCNLLPGPEAQQLAIYIGWLLHGTKGGGRRTPICYPRHVYCPGVDFALRRI